MCEKMSLMRESVNRRETRNGTTLVTLFERQVRKHPSRIALVAENDEISYRQLESRANQLARLLVAEGAGPEDCIALLFDRSSELIVALLATLKAGSAYLPLDPAVPSARISALLVDACPRLVLTTTALATRLSASGLPVRSVDAPNVRDAISIQSRVALSDHDRRAPLRPDNPAYIIYTSGSTGAPKGVLISHRNVERLFEQSRRWFSFSEQDTWTLFHSYSFDFSVWEIWG